MAEEFCRRRARELLAQLGVTEPPVDPEKVAGSLGLAVAFVSRGRGFSGRLLKEQMLIEVERANHPHRQRFTVAHETGHFVLDHSDVFCTLDDRDNSDPRRANEWQANVFASELLMPEPWVKDKWSRDKDFNDLAEQFFVSPEAMFRCLDDLGLLGLERRL